MRTMIRLVVMVAALVMSPVYGQTTAFTYQGKLSDAGLPANGQYDLAFSLFDAHTGGNQIGTTTLLDNVQVSNGIFTVTLDFGSSPFTGGTGKFLEIGVRPGISNDPPTVFAPRQPVNASPYAISTIRAGTADSLSSVCNPCVSDGHIVSINGNKVTGTVANAAAANTANNVTGIVPVANGGTGSSTQNFVDTSTTQTSIAGNKTFTGAVAVTGVGGVFNGNGLGLTNLNGANIDSNTIPHSAIQGGSSALNPQKFALQRFYEVNNSFPVIPLGAGPLGFGFDGTFIYVATLAGEVIRIRASTGSLEGAPIVMSNPAAFAFDGTFVYVANSNTASVTRIRASTGTIEGSAIPVGNFPDALTFDGAFVYVANLLSSNVTLIRASTGVVEGSAIAVGNSPRAIAFDGTFVYVANQGSSNVTRIRASTGAVEGSPIAVGSAPNGLVFDGTFVWVATVTGVRRIRASTGAVEGAAIVVGTSPRGMVFDGTFVYVTNFGSGNVSRIRASTGVVEGTPIPVGGGPIAIAFDGVNMYVANSSDSTVSRF